MNVHSISKRQVVSSVQKCVFYAKKEILATMLLQEEIKNPLPYEYHQLLKSKVTQGILLKRLGFGIYQEFIYIKEKYPFPQKGYQFRYYPYISHYQRLILIDRRIVFFKFDEYFFTTEDALLITWFRSYFFKQFRISIYR